MDNTHSYIDDFQNLYPHLVEGSPIDMFDPDCPGSQGSGAS